MTNEPAAKLKAYFVYDPRNTIGMEGGRQLARGEIVFAPSPGRAKTMSDMWCEEQVERHDYIALRAVRRPQYDEFVSRRRVPLERLMADGWTCMCERCGEVVTRDNLGMIDNQVPYCNKCRSFPSKF